MWSALTRPISRDRESSRTPLAAPSKRKSNARSRSSVGVAVAVTEVELKQLPSVAEEPPSSSVPTALETRREAMRRFTFDFRQAEREVAG